jgi:hypothetical protein
MSRDEYLDVTAAFVAKVSGAQRKMLLAHLDGPVDVDVSQDGKTRWTLIQRGLITADAATPYRPARPKSTRITDRGRQVVAYVLAEYADALVAAGYLDAETPPETPLQILRRLRAEGKTAKLRKRETCTADPDSLVHLSTSKAWTEPK